MDGDREGAPHWVPGGVALSEQDYAHARACVNALAGVADLTAVPEMYEALQSDTEQFRLRAESLKVERENNERLRADRDALRARAECAEANHETVLDQRDALRDRLDEETARLDYLEEELECEQQEIRAGLTPVPSLFRANLPITREAIDEARGRARKASP